MSLHQAPARPVPAETARVARAVFPKGNVYLTLRDQLGSLVDDTHYAALFAPRGRPALSPGLLALVTVLQFREGLRDRQAAEAVRASTPRCWPRFGRVWWPMRRKRRC